MAKPAPFVVSLVVLAVSALLALALTPWAEAQLPISKEYRYTGTGSCSASNCHGAKKPPAKKGDPDNTYTIWATKDKHNKAYTTLTKKESDAIVKKMALKAAPQEPKCTGCHALVLTKDQLTPKAKYNVEDGVSCDSCHGPAEKWLEGHEKGDKGGWPHSKSVGLGMYDTKDVLKRAELCVSCHLGIDAKMVEAGHPALTFELDSFSLNQPPHWKDEKEWFSMYAWGTGQAVALRDALQQVADRAKGNAPEALVRESWDQARGHAIAIRPLLAQIAADAGKALDQELEAIAGAFGKDRAKVASAAAAGAKVADGVAKKIPEAKFTRDVAWAVLKGQMADPQRAVSAGLRSAEQVAYAIDSVFRSVSAVAKPPEFKAIDAAIGKLFDELPPPKKAAEFKADRYIANLQNIAKNVK